MDLADLARQWRASAVKMTPDVYERGMRAGVISCAEDLEDWIRHHPGAAACETVGEPPGPTGSAITQEDNP